MPLPPKYARSAPRAVTIKPIPAGPPVVTMSSASLVARGLPAKTAWQWVNHDEHAWLVGSRVEITVGLLPGRDEAPGGFQHQDGLSGAFGNPVGDLAPGFHYLMPSGRVGVPDQKQRVAAQVPGRNTGRSDSEYPAVFDNSVRVGYARVSTRAQDH